MLNEIRTPAALSIAEKKELFTIELLKSGVEPQQAAEAAKIVATELTDDQLTSEQRQLVKAACAKWLKERKRQRPSLMQSFNSLPNVKDDG